MAANSKIEWTDHTFNAWVGCERLSPACDWCYAEAWARRTGNPDLWNGERRRTTAAYWRQPFKWNEAAQAAGHSARVFCCSLADVFDNQVPSEWRSDLLNLICETPWLEWQLLTKRPQNILKMLKPGELPNNAALGTTCEDQTRADQRVRQLLEAATTLSALYTFVSCEPLLGPVKLKWVRMHTDNPRFYVHDWLTGKTQYGQDDGSVIYGAAGKIDWVICGGESGPNARPMDPAWARSLRDQCDAASVPFLFKQWGEFAPLDTFSDADPDGHVYRCGKKAAGRLLDGKEHNEFPRAREAKAA